MSTSTGKKPHRRARSVRPQHHRAPANQARHDDLPTGARIADKVTAVFGSWGFILIQSALILIWLVYNGHAYPVPSAAIEGYRSEGSRTGVGRTLTA